MNKQLYRWIERIVIAVMMISIVGMFQPFALVLYGLAFPSLLAATLAFIVLSHVPVRE
jgi:hypothetical protein